MTNKILLKLAAKAAGIALYWAEDDPECDWVQGSYPRIPNNQVLEKWTWKIWNPLTDDGDALRLAVKLGLDIIQHSELKDGRLEVAVFHGAKGLELLPYGDDPYAATRRAIVRAAAEIGKTAADKSA